jgi:L-2-hydroxycarboxylate dehydrogenase (NAD+)
MSARLAAGSLLRFGAALLQHYGLPEADAAVVADALVQANLRGLDSHGVARLPVYCERLRRRCVNPRPQMKLEHATAVAARLDGDDGMGFVVGRRAMKEALAMAGVYGLGLVLVHRSTHYGMGALYVRQAIEAGFVALAFTNSSPAMAAWGGRSAFLGASPFAAGAPAAGEPFVLDMAMTVTARGKIRLAAQRGEPIAEGLALDSDGRPTTDARAAMAGVLLPFGGMKGSGLSLLMEVLCGVLTGAAFGGEVKNPYGDFSGPQNVGHFFLAIKPDLFMPRAQYEARMAALAARTKACPRVPGCDEILLPGEPEARTAAERARLGIPITADVLQALEQEAALAQVPLPAG